MKYLKMPPTKNIVPIAANIAFNTKRNSLVLSSSKKSERMANITPIIQKVQQKIKYTNFLSLVSYKKSIDTPNPIALIGIYNIKHVNTTIFILTQTSKNNNSKELIIVIIFIFIFFD